MDREQQLQDICQRYIGRYYDAPEVKTGLHADGADWYGYYPEVDASGLLTGELIDANYSDGFANVANEAMVAIASLPSHERRRIAREDADGTWDGFAEIPEPEMDDDLARAIDEWGDNPANWIGREDEARKRIAELEREKADDDSQSEYI